MSFATMSSDARQRRARARMGAAANAAKPSARRREPAFEGGSVTIRDIKLSSLRAAIHLDHLAIHEGAAI